MLIIKVIAIVILFCACVLIGYSESAKLQAKILCSEEAINLINDCLLHVKHEKMSTKSIIESIKNNKDKYLYIDCLNELLSDMKISKSNNLNSRQILIVNSCFYNLRTCCREEIIECFQNATDELKTIKKNVEEQIKSKLLLYKRMGIIAGLFISIILI